MIVVDQEPEASLGGQAFWSFGGLFFVGLARAAPDGHPGLPLTWPWQDWLGSAGFDRPEDEWPRRWAEAYVDFAAGEKRAWLHGKGVRFFPVVGWAERGGYGPDGARQLRAPVPHHLGHRARCRRAVRAGGRAAAAEPARSGCCSGTGSTG